MLNEQSTWVQQCRPKNKLFLANTLGVLYLAYSCYGTTYSQFSYFFAAKLSQCLVELASQTIQDKKTAMEVAKLLKWFLGLAVQFSFGWWQAPLLYTTSFIAETGFERLINEIFVSKLVRHQTDKNKASFNFARQAIGLIGYFVGFKAGEAIFKSSQLSSNMASSNSVLIIHQRRSLYLMHQPKK